MLDQKSAPVSPRDRFVGCLVGGAIGDALGAPVEFMGRGEIMRAFGPSGITSYAPAYGGLGRITDDTQMTLFTAEGLLRAHVRLCERGITTYSGVTAHAYLHWLQTQGEETSCAACSIAQETPGWLFQQKALHSRRAPGVTCISALKAMKSFGDRAHNDSKGCGGIMRIAPVGLFAARSAMSPSDTFDLGDQIARLTHGHPTGTLSAGVFAVLILRLVQGATLAEALADAKPILKRQRRHSETLRALEHAENLAIAMGSRQAAIAALGQGWIAEEALAIAVYCALATSNFEECIVLAVNHDGDSDSTGSLAGNLCGATHGIQALADKWLKPLELREVITEMAEDLYDFPTWDWKNERDRIWSKYPG
jgi:ADP-ribosylglycohydrolase